MAGLRVLGRALTTTPVFGFSVLLPPSRLSLSLINQPCSYATTRPLILPLPGSIIVDQAAQVEASCTARPGDLSQRHHMTARNQVRASAPVRQEARSSLHPALTFAPRLPNRPPDAARGRLAASSSGDRGLRASYSHRTGSHSRHRRRATPRTSTARPYRPVPPAEAPRW